MVQLRHVAPQDIESESFRIIEAELGPHNLPAAEFQIARRMIHATGDFSFAENVRFHPKAVEAGLAALRAGKNVLVDVHMAAAGISEALLARFGGRVICRMNEPETAELARRLGGTRADAAMRRSADEPADNVGIVAVGNAPTALLTVMDLIAEGRFAPDLVIGVPVGFVNAAESKELLAEKEFPYITVLGRKGGTPAAVAAVNALLRIAGED